MISVIITTKIQMPQDSKDLVAIYKKIIDPKFKDWVVFESGTCVIIYNHQMDLKEEARGILKKYGAVTPGTESADFTIMKVEPGWIVTGNQPGILNYVSEDEGGGKEDFEIGLIGRNKKELDGKESKIIYINQPV